MARGRTVPERGKELVAELLAEEAAEDVGGRPQNIHDIEDAMVGIGDLAAASSACSSWLREVAQPQ